jgi:protein ImuA
MVTRVLDGVDGVDGVDVASSTAPGRAVAGVLTLAAEWRQAEERGRETVSTGFQSLDRLLPAGGVRRGSLIEWLAGGCESAGAGGAISLACAVACRLADPRWAEQARASTIVVVDRGQLFYPPAVIPWLDALADTAEKRSERPHLVVARPSRDDDEFWTIDQALRCPGVAAVLAWPKLVHATAMRRWQLASRTSGAVGLLVRGLSERGAVNGGPTWADAKLAISPVPGTDSAADLTVRRLRLSLAGGPWAGNEMLEERSTELRLDLTSGREATRRHRMPVRHAGQATPVAAAGLQAGRFQPEGVACRAS